MTTTKLSTFALAILVFSACNTAPQKNEAVIKVPAYEAIVLPENSQETNWGYIIFHQQKQLIKQFTIPALKGNQLFRDKKQAAMVGNLVAEKLNHSLHPTISVKELDSMGIISPTNETIKK